LGSFMRLGYLVKVGIKGQENKGGFKYRREQTWFLVEKKERKKIFSFLLFRETKQEKKKWRGGKRVTLDLLFTERAKRKSGGGGEKDYSGFQSGRSDGGENRER